MDDALSVEFDFGGRAGRARVGIHIADVASRVPCASPLFAWAKVTDLGLGCVLAGGEDWFWVGVGVRV